MSSKKSKKNQFNFSLVPDYIPLMEDLEKFDDFSLQLYRDVDIDAKKAIRGIEVRSVKTVTKPIRPQQIQMFPLIRTLQEANTPIHDLYDKIRLLLLIFKLA